MDEQEREMLEETLELAKENHEILISLRSHNRLSLLIKTIYWFIIIFLAFGIYYFVNPVIKSVGETIGQTRGTLEKIGDIPGEGIEKVKEVQDSFSLTSLLGQIFRKGGEEEE